MKCTNKITAALMGALMLATTLFSGCGGTAQPLEQAYDVYDTTNTYDLSAANVSDVCSLFSEDVCVVGFDETFSDNGVNTAAAEAAGVFSVSDDQAKYAKNVFEKLYPASTTKIMTAYLALKYGNLDDVITVSPKAAGYGKDSSLCFIEAGEKYTLRDLLYGMMLASGNDAATAIAEYISGSTEDFAKLMNEEAYKLGATRSHFVNPHGLPDDNHYTTLYDLYLIFNQAIQYDEFVDVIQSKSYTATYTSASGEKLTREWENTNRYLTGEAKSPTKITVIGGKTGTTNAAGCCLVLLSENSDNQPIISIVLKADNKDNLYQLMSNLLSNFSN